MDKIARICQEIERLKEPHKRNLKKPMERGRIGYAHGIVDCCDKILDCIDSLQQEQPEVDLAEEIKNYFKGFYMDLTDQGYILKNSDGPVGLMSVKDIACHFYELGRKQVLQEIYDGKTKPVDKITAAWLDD